MQSCTNYDHQLSVVACFRLKQLNIQQTTDQYTNIATEYIKW